MDGDASALQGTCILLFGEGDGIGGLVQMCMKREWGKGEMFNMCCGSRCVVRERCHVVCESFEERQPRSVFFFPMAHVRS